MLELFSKKGELVPKDVTPWQSFSGKGMTFWLVSYDWNNCACVSHLTMRAFFGMMKMDTLICTPYAKDMPLLSYDLICALWKRTLLVEAYDTMVEPVDLSAMLAVKVKYNDFKQTTHSYTGNSILNDIDEILPIARSLLANVDTERPVRLLGLTVASPILPENKSIDYQLTFDWC